jgi:hypothetical protein
LRNKQWLHQGHLGFACGAEGEPYMIMIVFAVDNGALADFSRFGGNAGLPQYIAYSEEF